MNNVNELKNSDLLRRLGLIIDAMRSMSFEELEELKARLNKAEIELDEMEFQVDMGGGNGGRIHNERMKFTMKREFVDYLIPARGALEKLRD